MTRFRHLELNPVRTTAPLNQQHLTQQGVIRVDAMHDADQCRRAGQFEEALRCYSRALEMDRSLLAGWLGQVQMLIELGEYPEAELWSRKALELFRENGEIMAGRAQALCRMGDRQQAQPLSDGAIARPEQSAYRWMVRGEIMLAQKDGKEQLCFDKAQLADPDWLVSLEIARIYLHYGRPAKALTYSRKVVEQTPDQAYCWFLHGSIQADLAFTGLSEQSLQRCLELSPKHADARARLHALRSGSGLFSRVRGWFRRRSR